MSKYPKWYQIAEKEIGTLELAGSGNNPRVIEYHSVTSLRATKDSVPWCASFVSWCLEQAKIPSARSAWARSYLKFGDRLKLPLPGCIVVLERGANSGHVGFFERYDEVRDRVYLLGGNQKDAVCISGYARSRVLGYFWPHGVELPEGTKVLKPIAAHK